MLSCISQSNQYSVASNCDVFDTILPFSTAFLEVVLRNEPFDKFLKHWEALVPRVSLSTVVYSPQS
jgi:hypothetical protein